MFLTRVRFIVFNQYKQWENYRKTVSGDSYIKAESGSRCVKTFLIVWFNTEGLAVSEVTGRLMDMGFKPVTGKYDFVYDWGKNASLDDALTIGDRVRSTLSDCNVAFKLETV